MITACDVFLLIRIIVFFLLLVCSSIIKQLPKQEDQQETSTQDVGSKPRKNLYSWEENPSISSYRFFIDEFQDPWPTLKPFQDQDQLLKNMLASLLSKPSRISSGNTTLTSNHSFSAITTDLQLWLPGSNCTSQVWTRIASSLPPAASVDLICLLDLEGDLLALPSALFQHIKPPQRNRSPVAKTLANSCRISTLFFTRVERKRERGTQNTSPFSTFFVALSCFFLRIKERKMNVSKWGRTVSYIQVFQGYEFQLLGRLDRLAGQPDLGRHCKIQK